MNEENKNALICLGILPKTLDKSEDTILLLAGSKEHANELSSIALSYTALRNADSVFEYINSIGVDIGFGLQRLCVPYIAEEPRVVDMTQDWFNNLTITAPETEAGCPLEIFPSVRRILADDDYAVGNFNSSTDLFTDFVSNFFNKRYEMNGDKLMFIYDKDGNVYKQYADYEMVYVYNNTTPSELTEILKDCY